MTKSNMERNVSLDDVFEGVMNPLIAVEVLNDGFPLFKKVEMTEIGDEESVNFKATDGSMAEQKEAVGLLED